MESYLNELITAEFSSMDASEVLLERRLSPYATLRPGDLAALLNQLQHSHPAALAHCCLSGSIGQVSEEEDEKEETAKEEAASEVVVRGQDQGHVPASYVVRGLRRHEMPVIGVCVDSRICPGFRYRVRRLGSSKEDFLWRGQARTLLSIGMGYGRRITFQDDQLNDNECFFWSDSDPAGYAFSIQAVNEGDQFLVQSPEGAILGEARVEQVHEPQAEEEEETSSEVKGHVEKSVAVHMTCSLTYYHKHHTGLVELMPHEGVETVQGRAKLIHSKGSSKASVQAVEDIFIPRLGDCLLVPES